MGVWHRKLHLIVKAMVSTKEEVWAGIASLDASSSLLLLVSLLYTLSLLSWQEVFSMFLSRLCSPYESSSPCSWNDRCAGGYI